MTEPYQPRYTWRQTRLDENDPPTDLDWCGFDGDGYIGRIRKETTGKMQGRWQWAGSYPRMFKGVRETPNMGWVDTARQATQKIEEFWDRSLAKMASG